MTKKYKPSFKKEFKEIIKNTKVKTVKMTKEEMEKWQEKNIKDSEKWENSIDGIGNEMDGDLDSIPQYAQYGFLRALSYLPKNIRRKAISSCVFLSGDKKNRGAYYSFKDDRWKDKKGFIYFSPLLWELKPIEIDFCVAHEIVHFLRNSQIEAGKQLRQFEEEKEADELAIKWLQKKYNKNELLKICNYFKNPKWEKYGRKAKQEDKRYKEMEKKVEKNKKRFIKSMEKNKLLSIKEVAGKFDKSTRQIRRYARSGKLKTVMKKT